MYINKRCVKGLAAQICRSAAAANGFLNILGKLWYATQPPSIRHPGSFRALRDIHVTKLLVFEQNIKKSQFAFANAARHICAASLSRLTE